MTFTQRRLIFGALAILSFVTGVMIFLNPQWTFIRQHVGDAVAAFLVFCCLAMFTRRTATLAYGTLLIAIGIELLQAVGLFTNPNELTQALFGHVFDWVDIGMYVIGTAVGCCVSYLINRHTN